ncbi:MAG: ribonuclease III [Alphaproteobacteria bacterium]|nr:ribonuclease III [Alphaproteobacteria bacterium]
MSAGPGELEAVLGHAFTDRSLLRRAVTHRSAACAVDGHGYQRLEFLGDHILGAIIATMVFRDHVEASEGELSRRYARLVANQTLGDIALELGIDRFVVVGPHERKGGMRRNASILADVIEALIGALYLDAGYGAAEAFVRRSWQTRLRLEGGSGRDDKTRLQEWALKQGLALPGYHLLDMTGPDHAPLITVEVHVEGFAGVRASGRTRRAAEQLAARTFLTEVPQ